MGFSKLFCFFIFLGHFVIIDEKNVYFPLIPLIQIFFFWRPLFCMEFVHLEYVCHLFWDLFKTMVNFNFFFFCCYPVKINRKHLWFSPNIYSILILSRRGTILKVWFLSYWYSLLKFVSFIAKYIETIARHCIVHIIFDYLFYLVLNIFNSSFLWNLDKIISNGVLYFPSK